MRRLALIALLSCSVAAQAAEYRFIGPWFTTATINTANGQPSLVAGQNDRDLGISFTCFDRRVSLGVWRPGGSLGLPVAERDKLTVKIDVYDPIYLVGFATRENLAEFDENIGLVVRQMLVGRQIDVLFVDHAGHETHQMFRLDNAGLAFAQIGQSCPL